MASGLRLRSPDFSKLEERVRDSRRKRQALEQMLILLKKHKHFDEQDTQSVEQTLLEVLTEEKNAITELDRRKKIYKESLLTAQQQVQERHIAMSKLNETTEVLELFPNLAEQFAKRQRHMLKLVEDATRKLEADA